MSNPNQSKKIMRIARYSVFGICLVMAYMLTTRFELWTLQENSMFPAFRPGVRLLLDLEPRPPRHGDTVLYEYKGMARVARIAAMGGDKLQVRDHILQVDGESSIHRVKAPEKVPAQVPPGQLYLLNDNPDCPSPDSLAHGPVLPGAIRARVITAIDFF